MTVAFRPRCVRITRGHYKGEIGYVTEPITGTSWFRVLVPDPIEEKDIPLPFNPSEWEEIENAD